MNRVAMWGHIYGHVREEERDGQLRLVLNLRVNADDGSSVSTPVRIDGIMAQYLAETTSLSDGDAFLVMGYLEKDGPVTYVQAIHALPDPVESWLAES